jgi:hypothetical protein
MEGDSYLDFCLAWETQSSSLFRPYSSPMIKAEMDHHAPEPTVTGTN